MNYGALKTLDIANGPGCRVSLFVSGCRNHCKGCFQPETWDFNYGKPFTGETVVDILSMLEDPHNIGLSILGGDPLEPENQQAVYYLCFLVKQRMPEKTIWLWTGYLWENVKDYDLMKYLDVLVDGPFVESQKNLCLAYCGSENQRIIDVQKSLKTGEVILYHDDNMKKGMCVYEPDILKQPGLSLNGIGYT